MSEQNKAFQSLVKVEDFKSKVSHNGKTAAYIKYTNPKSKNPEKVWEEYLHYTAIAGKPIVQDLLSLEKTYVIGIELCLEKQQADYNGRTFYEIVRILPAAEYKYTGGNKGNYKPKDEAGVISGGILERATQLAIAKHSAKVTCAHVGDFTDGLINVYFDLVSKVKEKIKSTAPAVKEGDTKENTSLADLGEGLSDLKEPEADIPLNLDLNNL